jgi:hypothetical protein
VTKTVTIQPYFTTYQTLIGYCTATKEGETIGGTLPSNTTPLAAVWVKSVDVYMRPREGKSKDDYFKGKVSNDGRMCLTYRTSDDNWHQYLQPKVPTWNEATGHFVMHFSVQAPLVNAVNVFFNQEDNLLLMDRIVIATDLTKSASP